MRAPCSGAGHPSSWVLGALALWLAACAKAPGPPPPQPPPVVVASSPAAGQLRVAADAPISVTFNRPLAAATVDETTFTVAGPSGPVAGAVSLAGATATFTPTAPLASGAAHVARLAASVESADGVALGAPVEVAFTTVPVARWAFALEADRIDTFALDEQGWLLRRGAIPFARTASPPALSSSADGGWVFASHQPPPRAVTGEVRVFRADVLTGGLTLAATLSTSLDPGEVIPLPALPFALVPLRSNVAVISLHPALPPAQVSGSPFSIGPFGQLLPLRDGRHLLTLADGALRTIDVEATTGALSTSALTPVTTGATGPMALSSDGQALLVADAAAARLEIYRIDAATGGATAVPGSPVAVPGLSGPVYVDALGTVAVALAGQALHAWSIAPTTGALSPLAGSPVTLPAASSAAIDPGGAAVVVWGADGAGTELRIYRLTGGQLAQEAGSPVTLDAPVFRVTFEPSRGRFLALTSQGVARLEVGATGRRSFLGTPPIQGLALGAAAGPARCQPSRLYAARGAASIEGYSIDPTSGALAPLGGSPYSTASAVSSLVADAAGRGLFAALAGQVAAFLLPPSGAPSPRSSAGVSASPAPQSVVIGPDGRTLVVARAGAIPAGQGPLVVLRLTDGDGLVDTGSFMAGVSPGPTGLAADPAGRFLLYTTGAACALGVAGALEAPAPVAGGPWVIETSCSAAIAAAVDGPGHVAFASWSLGPTGGGLTSFVLDPFSGALTRADTHAGLPFSPSIAPDPLGRFVYASAYTGALLGWSVDAAGQLTDLPSRGAGSTGSQLAIDPSGHFLYAGNGAGELHAFRIGDTGELTPVAGSPFSAGGAVSSLAATADCR